MKHNKFLRFNNGTIFESFSDDDDYKVSEIQWRKSMTSFKDLVQTFKDLNP